MLNAVNSVLDDVSSVSPSSCSLLVSPCSLLWRRANARNVSQHTLYDVQHIYINLTLIHCTSHKLSLPWLIIKKILLFWIYKKQTFRMFSLCDLRFVLCSRDLDVLRAQRFMTFFILITHKSTRSENLITWQFVLCYLSSSHSHPIYFFIWGVSSSFSCKSYPIHLPSQPPRVHKANPAEMISILLWKIFQ